jgi:RNA polymerase sigma-70 factor (ECF subfamily)
MNKPDGKVSAGSPTGTFLSRALKSEAERLFYEKHRSPVYQYIFRRVRHHATAEDILQDTFIKYMEVPRPEVDSQTGYIFKIAYHLIVARSELKRDALIHADSGHDSLSSLEIQHVTVDPISNVNNQMDGESRLLALPESLRYVVGLFLKGMPVPAIAKGCRASEAAVYRRLKKAIDMLSNSTGQESPRKECT